MAHPAFPSLPPAPSQNITTSAQIRGLIESCSDLPAIESTLIPSLNNVLWGKSQGSKGDKKKIAKGEELLAMGDADLSGVGDEEMKAKTAGLLYVWYVLLSFGLVMRRR